MWGSEHLWRRPTKFWNRKTRPPLSLRAPRALFDAATAGHRTSKVTVVHWAPGRAPSSRLVVSVTRQLGFDKTQEGAQEVQRLSMLFADSLAGAVSLIIIMAMRPTAVANSMYQAGANALPVA